MNDNKVNAPAGATNFIQVTPSIIWTGPITAPDNSQPVSVTFPPQTVQGTSPADVTEMGGKTAPSAATEREPATIDFGFKADPQEVEIDGEVGLLCKGFASRYHEEDAVGEEQLPGAFRAFGEEWFAQKEPLVLYNHAMDSALGARPIGRGISYKMLPDGIYVEVFVPKNAADTWQDKRAKKRFREIYNGIKSAVIRGFSVGGAFTRFGKKLANWATVELSITPAPCLASATFALGRKAVIERYGAVPVGLGDIGEQPAQSQNVLGILTRAHWNTAMGLARKDGAQGLHDHLLSYEPALQGQHDSEDCSLCAERRDMMGIKAQTTTAPGLGICLCCGDGPCICADDCPECGGKDSCSYLSESHSGSKAAKQKDAYLVAEGDNPSDWHLPVKKGGDYDRGLCGAAWAALHGGYRGNKYEGPKKAEALAKLKRIYKSQGWDLPGADGESGGKSDDLDLDATTVVQQATDFLVEFGRSVKAGQRHSAETKQAVKFVIDHLTSTFGLEAEASKDAEKGDSA